MDWKECKDKNFVKEVKINENLVNSLINSSKNKLESGNRLELDETTASTKVSIVYDSLRELLEALAIKKGFKIYNHDCFCAFLHEICQDKASSLNFDKFRKIRNQINYYGKDVPKEEAKTIIKEIISLRNNIISKYFKGTKWKKKINFQVFTLKNTNTKMKKEDIEFLNQLVDSLRKAGMKLERAYQDSNYEEFNKIKKFIIKLQENILETLEWAAEKYF